MAKARPSKSSNTAPPVDDQWRIPDPKLNKVAVWTYYKGALRDEGVDEGGAVGVAQAVVEGQERPGLDAVQEGTGLADRLASILRAGAYELVHRRDIPPRVSINEYTTIAHAFFSGKEPGLANGVLDKLGRALRSSEM